ncbi:hypothetical protein EJ05DRAFT_502586 [Pseudovirgaria hyperparasitica]|uniref:Uncharacterized protein n=1 Tax=Pseudovirgaria hyperparasitica TaxID=470096 RepID=A0A6A6W2E1_9PEZI|nr:uncharacterized protein EJ05DRAFT_502586 [Pseudovirgaria hyperparasitica]KAF2756120.1 hypothetical protein EJ05DRAFT_502586 [Pseudovirgaria hyperparasitica]
MEKAETTRRGVWDEEVYCVLKERAKSTKGWGRAEEAKAEARKKAPSPMSGAPQHDTPPHTAPHTRNPPPRVRRTDAADQSGVGRRIFPTISGFCPPFYTTFFQSLLTPKK